MIGKLTGRLEYRAQDHVLIDVRGVGYIVYCSDRTMAALPGVGEAVALYTELLVREDLMQLFGFTSLLEKEWHRLLTSVQGVGAKVSLAILSALGPDGVSRAIALGDWAAVKAAKGVGPKTAQRIVLDLKDKAPGVMAMGGTVTEAMDGPELDAVVETGEPAPAAKPARKNKKQQKQPSGAAAASAGALSALGNLGYGPSDAAAAVAEAAAAEPEAGEAELIRAALRLLAPKG
ncbi:Holliday junction branch migration protein RuvA [Phaeobacter gallaeciensis]|uniref:Holliday junction branch migration protein RuvA n=1 Tax=Phaeobacter gallaeciensis TaxID=60890 RepID=UPI00237F117A|nr:Holliday junction branch migration protein RuvA [Phaeobacter gallaeciensis]MDE4190646.1 Holliday junction branch migration protein RuvA [Phaeobacter gallaeciensis]MDE4197861.1 Holliday junction branch migration protein RuvA [Phaeobacter gallaeciensis]MDE4202003.1 Holliday junction branch migration protein RuvA [Phaeobacter gallaeciensis]MDE4206697.1 Holliday junction branch migration protein RuvA [Phaeobacter gallaeciensis]MDE4215065.1 Holliday junction branch migration protein RuvA [Phaeob